MFFIILSIKWLFSKSLSYFLFFFAPFFSLRRLLVSSCLCVLTVPAIMLRHTHTHKHRVDSPHPSQTDTGRAQHDIQTAPRATRWGASTSMLPSCTNTHTVVSKHTHKHAQWCVQLDMCRRHLCRHTLFSASKFLPTCPLRDIIRSPFLKLRGNSENKASSKAGGGGGAQCKRRGGHRTRWMGVEEREEWGSLMCWDAPVADLVLPPLIYRDQSLCVILHWLCGSLAPAQ